MLHCKWPAHNSTYQVGANPPQPMLISAQGLV